MVNQRKYPHREFLDSILLNCSQLKYIKLHILWLALFY